eukprot:4816961-Pleurochrysis_carterae.AAC.1
MYIGSFHDTLTAVLQWYKAVMYRERGTCRPNQTLETPLKCKHMKGRKGGRGRARGVRCEEEGDGQVEEEGEGQVEEEGEGHVDEEGEGD